MRKGPTALTVASMTGTFAVLWTFHRRVHSGSVEAYSDRLELRTRGRALSIPYASVVHFVIERGPAARINGLAVLKLVLEDGDIVRLASMEGTGVLHELSAVLAPAVAEAVHSG